MTHDPARLARDLQPEFEVLRTLGEGSLTTVLLARETALRRLVAIKVPRPEWAEDPEARGRFDREARSAARLSHPGIAHVHRIGALPDGRPFLVLEYVEGRTLSDTLAAEGRFRPREGLEVVRQIAEALAAAHQQGIVHRDVRPDKVIWNARDRRAALTDFGVAGILETGSERVTRLTRVGQVIGELTHASPEQLRAEPVGPATDVYALGVLAYHVLAGEGPYPTPSAPERATAHLTRPPRDVRDLASGMDERVAELLLRCLDPLPGRRPTAERVADVARAVLSGESASADSSHDDGPVRRFVRELRRRRVTNVVLGYLAAAFLALQVGELVLPALLSDRAYEVMVVVVVAGFPAALVLGWIFDVTRGGVRRTEAAPSAGADRGVRVLQGLGLALSLAVAVAAGWYFLAS